GDEGRAPRSGDDHTRRPGIGAAQIQLVVCAGHGREPESRGERLGGDQIGLLELQPGEVADLDDRIRRTPGVLSAQAALVAVQVGMVAESVAHLCRSSRYDDIVTYERTVSQAVWR